MLLGKLTATTTVPKTEWKGQDSRGWWHVQTDHATFDDTSKHCYYNCKPGVVSSLKIKCPFQVLFSNYSEYSSLLLNVNYLWDNWGYWYSAICFPLGSKTKPFKQWKFSTSLGCKEPIEEEMRCIFINVKGKKNHCLWSVLFCFLKNYLVRINMFYNSKAKSYESI